MPCDASGFSRDHWLIESQEASLARVSDWIRAADAKSSPILAIGAAMIATLIAFAAKPGAWSGSSPYWLAFGATLPVLSSVFIAVAMLPRIRGETQSLLFFGDVAKLSREVYSTRVGALTPAAYLLDLASQVHVNSRIAAAKFTWTRRATLVLLIGMVPWLLALFALAGG